MASGRTTAALVRGLLLSKYAIRQRAPSHADFRLPAYRYPSVLLQTTGVRWYSSPLKSPRASYGFEEVRSPRISLQIDYNFLIWRSNRLKLSRPTLPRTVFSSMSASPRNFKPVRSRQPSIFQLSPHRMHSRSQRRSLRIGLGFQNRSAKVKLSFIASLE